MSHAYTTAGWENFFFAEVGASAALTGLLFVAVSINLPKIIEIQSMPGRAIEALTLLIGVMFFGTFALVPGQPSWLFGVEATSLGVIEWIWTRVLQRRATTVNVPRPFVIMRVICAQLSTLPLVICGVSICCECGGGLYWAVPAIIFSVLTAMIASWVLLVEIKR